MVLLSVGAMTILSFQHACPPKKKKRAKSRVASTASAVYTSNPQTGSVLSAGSGLKKAGRAAAFVMFRSRSCGWQLLFCLVETGPRPDDLRSCAWQSISACSARAISLVPPLRQCLTLEGTLSGKVHSRSLSNQKTELGPGSEPDRTADNWFRTAQVSSSIFSQSMDHSQELTVYNLSVLSGSQIPAP